MNEKQASRMLTLAAFIEKLPRHNLDQLCWVTLSEPETIENLLDHECWSSCCALGWAAVLDQKEWSIGLRFGNPALLIHRKSNLAYWDGACEYFGINAKEARNVFSVRDRTPERQAVVMRKLVHKYGWYEA